MDEYEKLADRVEQIAAKVNEIIWHIDGIPNGESDNDGGQVCIWVDSLETDR